MRSVAVNLISPLTLLVISPKCSLLHLDVKHDPLVLFHMDAPDAILSLVVGLGPIRRQHNASRVSDLPAAHGCNTQTLQPHRGIQMCRIGITIT